MKICKHEHIISVNQQKEIAGLTFTYESKQCEECKKVLWNPENETQFRNWLNVQKKENRDRFIVQKIQISDHLIEFANQLANRHHCNVSSVYRVCLSLYFVYGEFNPNIVSHIDSISVSENNTSSQKKVVVNPSVFVKMESNAKLFNMNMNEVASWVIQRVLTLAKSEEKNNDILPQIEYALEAA